MEQTSALETVPAAKGRKKRSSNKLLVAAILVIGVLSVAVLGLTIWTVMGTDTTAPQSVAQRGVIVAEAAVEANPKDVPARIAAAKANLLAGNYDRAIEYADSAIKLGKDVSGADLLKGQAYAAKGDEGAARKLFEKLANGESSDATMALLSLAALDAAAGKFEPALASLAKAVEMDPLDANIKVELANIQVAAGKLDEAVATYVSALQLVPDLEPAFGGLAKMEYGPAEFILAQAAWERGEKDEAARLMQRAVDLSPEIAWLHVALGDFREMVGDKVGAETAYRAALAKDPNSEEAKAGLAALGK